MNFSSIKISHLKRRLISSWFRLSSWIFHFIYFSIVFHLILCHCPVSFNAWSFAHSLVCLFVSFSVDYFSFITCTLIYSPHNIFIFRITFFPRFHFYIQTNSTIRRRIINIWLSFVQIINASNNFLVFITFVPASLECASIIHAMILLHCWLLAEIILTLRPHSFMMRRIRFVLNFNNIYGIEFMIAAWMGEIK